MYDRKKIMELMRKTDEFFTAYGLVDDKAFEDGAISKKNKELCMVTVSIVTKCSECIDFHLEESIKAGASLNELVEAIKMGLMAGGSTTYPYARKSFGLLIEKNIIREMK